MEAAVEELTPLGVLKQPNEGWTYSRAGEVHSNLAGARDIERRAIPKCAMPAVPPPAWKLGFDQPCRSVNRARYIRGHRAKRILELGVEFRQATESGLDLVQKFPHRRGTGATGGALSTVFIGNSSFAADLGARFRAAAVASNALSLKPPSRAPKNDSTPPFAAVCCFCNIRVEINRPPA